MLDINKLRHFFMVSGKLRSLPTDTPGTLPVA